MGDYCVVLLNFVWDQTLMIHHLMVTVDFGCLILSVVFEGIHDTSRNSWCLDASQSLPFSVWNGNRCDRPRNENFSGLWFKWLVLMTPQFYKGLWFLNIRQPQDGSGWKRLLRSSAVNSALPRHHWNMLNHRIKVNISQFTHVNQFNTNNIKRVFLNSAYWWMVLYYLQLFAVI